MKSVPRVFFGGVLLAYLPVCSYPQQQTTNIEVSSSIAVPRVKRLGINLGGSTYYDSGQMMKNLLLNNPGFEGEIYQSVVRCSSGTANTCVDDNQWSSWKDGFWNGATFEVFFGASQGRTGIIQNYTAAAGQVAGRFAFSASGVAPAAGDYMIVRMTVPGNAMAGWWPTTSKGGIITTNFTDLPPGTAGKQTAAVSAPTDKDWAVMTAYFDSTVGVSFVQMNGDYQLSFKAKGTGGTNSIAIGILRFSSPNQVYLDQTVALTDSWQTYNLTLSPREDGAIGTVAVTFSTSGQDSFLLDDVSLALSNSDRANQTAFRDPVVEALHDLNPGVLRFWASQLGDTLDNLIADPYGRQRSGFSAFDTQQNTISYGLHEFLELCATSGAEPWFVVPATFSSAEAWHIIEYLAGDSTTRYGAIRAMRGQVRPWTELFHQIHLEFGNEAWNSTFKGGSIEYPQPYGNRAQSVFAAMRTNELYNAASFDLVLGGQAAYPVRNRDIQNSCNNNDSFTIATYMMGTVNMFDTNENLFAPTFAEAEVFNSGNGTAEDVSGPGGLVFQNQQVIQASAHPVPLAVYETNMSTLAGSIPQDVLNRYASSVGAGLAVVENMLLGLRQFGITTQNLFSLPQYQFLRSDGEVVQLWGSVIDMGGETGRRRPAFLALQLANLAIGKGAPLMFQTVHSGADPTWNQPMVNAVQLNGAHYLQSFAFAQGSGRSLIVFNLHRTSSLPVTISGENAPEGSVLISQLTSANITDTNELANNANIVITQNSLTFDDAPSLSLPPYSMTVLNWEQPVVRRRR